MYRYGLYRFNNPYGVIWAETGLDSTFIDPIASWIALPIAQRLYPGYGFWPQEDSSDAISDSGNSDSGKQQRLVSNSHRRVWSYSFRYGEYDAWSGLKKTAEKNGKEVNDPEAK